MRSGRLVSAAETSKEHAEWRRLQRTNLNKLLKRKEWSQCQRKQLASTPEPPLPKGNEQSRQSIVPDHEWGRDSRWTRAAPWRERGGLEREHEEVRMDSTVNKRRFQGGK